MRKAIAIDFDGCLCVDAYPSIGEPNWAVINRAKAEQRRGAGLILWTCREGQLLQEAVEACRGWGLTFDALNESLPDWIEAFGTQPRKVGASEYWDDKAARIPTALRFFVGGPGDDSIELIAPNKPLTLEKLRQMDGEPVWVATTAGHIWALVDVQENGSILLRNSHGDDYEADMVFYDGTICRYKPRGVK